MNSGELERKDKSKHPPLPAVSYGYAGNVPINWRYAPADPTPDDDVELPTTPADVVNILGFDPLDEGQ